MFCVVLADVLTNSVESNVELFTSTGKVRLTQALAPVGISPGIPMLTLYTVLSQFVPEPLLNANIVKLLGEIIVSLHEQVPSESIVTLFWLVVAMENSEVDCVEAGVMMGSSVSLTVEPAARSAVS